MKFASVRDRYSEAEVAQFYDLGLWGNETLFSLVERGAEAHPGKVFGTDSTTSLTYRQIRDGARAVAAGLRQRGIGAGDAVLVQLPSWTDFFVIAAGIARVGAVLVPVMPIYRDREIAHIVETVDARAVFTAGTYRGFDHAAAFGKIAADRPDFRTVVVVRDPAPAGTLAFADLCSARASDDELGPGPSPDDPFVVVFSSGTTSRPKGCLHTFNTMACGARLLGKGWSYSSSDVQFGPSPLTHTTGLVTSYLLPLVHGASSHLMEQWDPREALERIERHRCTACVSATTFLQMILEVYDPSAHDASSLRFWTAAGAPIPGSFVKEARSAVPGMAVLSLYGRTENITTTMCTIDDDPERSVTSDGKALPHQEVRIVDDRGEEVPRGDQGDIAYRGAMNCLGYVGQPEETAENYTADGFHRSGDLGRMDEDGYVRVTGRTKDIVIRGGMNISVREVEDALSAHPDVVGVALVGMPDRQLGERVCCYLVLRDGVPEITLEAVREYLLDLGLAIQKVPERLEIVAELPTTPTGKIQKHVLRADIASKLGEREGISYAAR